MSEGAELCPALSLPSSLTFLHLLSTPCSLSLYPQQIDPTLKRIYLQIETIVFLIKA